MEERACKNCSNWKRVRDNVGQCRAKPPLAQPGWMGAWPASNEADWCGEFSGNDQADAASKEGRSSQPVTVPESSYAFTVSAEGMAGLLNVDPIDVVRPDLERMQCGDPVKCFECLADAVKAPDCAVCNGKGWLRQLGPGGGFITSPNDSVQIGNDLPLPRGRQDGPIESEPKSGLDLIAAERRRQVDDEGWTPKHDDQHGKDELAKAAACYCVPERMREREVSPIGTTVLELLWPFDDEWWKPKPDDRVRELVKAGALIAAEIDRLQRKK